MKKIIFVALLVLTLMACNNKPSTEKSRTGKDDAKPLSWGKNETIFVISDDNLWKDNEEFLKRNLSRKVFTTEEEAYFELEHANYANFEKYYRFKNLVLMADLSSADETSKYIKSLLNENSIKQIQTNKVAVFENDNWLARDQFMLIIAAENAKYLKKLNQKMLDQVFDPFKQKYYQRRTRKVYARPVHNNTIFNGFPFSLQLTTNFVNYKSDAKNKIFSYLNRVPNSGPDRYITVTWENLKKEDFTRKWFIEKRKKLAWDLYEEDEFKLNDVRTEKYKFNNFNGYKIVGRWTNQKFAVGGAFQSFAFYDENKQRVYIIDTPIYFPAGFKLPELVELEIIAKSIKLK